MARPQDSPILAQLRSAKTHTEQKAALQALKNEVVGNIQRKEAWVKIGVLEPIVDSLTTDSSPAKLNGKDKRLPQLPRALSDDDGVKLQALQIIGSFAQGGPMFLRALFDANALPAVIAHTSPFTNAPQITVAALRALTAIAITAELGNPSLPLTIETVANSLFTPPHLESLSAILSCSSPEPIFQSRVSLAAELIRQLCLADQHQHALAAAGVLDVLATKLASYAVGSGCSIPGARAVTDNDGLIEFFPEPAPRNMQLAPILDAIGAVLGTSKYRANRLVNSPSVLAVFPPLRYEPRKGLMDPRKHLTTAGLSAVPQNNLTAMESMLPAVPISKSRGSPASTPQTPYRPGSHTPTRTPLGKSGPATACEPSLSSPAGSGLEVDPDGVESPLIPWLIHVIRSQPCHTRIAAAAVLAALFKAGLGLKGFRETSIGMLVVPVLVGMLAKTQKALEATTKDAGPSVEESLAASDRMILERIPFVLARLIAERDFLSRSAYECHAVESLSALLKHAYTPSQVQIKRYWSPDPDDNMAAQSASAASQALQTGCEEELTPSLLHKTKVRESVLKAIAALAAGREEFRKSFIIADIFAYVVESLSEFPSVPTSSKDRAKDSNGNVETRVLPSPEYGRNPLAVIIASCHAIRIFARSPSVLRTALVDYGIALPVLKLMQHPDINVQIAATAVIANLVVDVSPVRELLIENDVLRVLCENAHSENPVLRLNALWSLKHLVNSVGSEVKKSCLQQLGPGWLLELISDDGAVQNTLAKAASYNGLDEDTDMQSTDETAQPVVWSDGIPRKLDASQSSKLRQADDRLSSIREAESDPLRKARNDDVAIQEQALDFIRNLIGPGSGPSLDSTRVTADLIDHLLNELGEDRLFEVLSSRLHAKVLQPFSRRSTGAGREAKIFHPHARIIMAIVYILVHMAASIPRHRQLVLAHSELLRMLVQHAGNKDREVRVALCHLVTNLTEQDDDSDAQACASRADVLRTLGFQNKMQTMWQEDRDLEVKERAKTAVFQMEQVL